MTRISKKLRLTIVKGDELKSRREKLGMTQAELAKVLDLHEMTVSKFERDLQPIPRVIELAMKEVERQYR